MLAGSTGGPISPGGDSKKLASLLALAAGAAACPQSGVADIVYTDLSSSPAEVGWQFGSSSYMFPDLPGAVQFGFARHQSTKMTYYSLTSFLSRWVSAGQMGGTATAGVRVTPTYSFFAKILPGGATWSSGSGGLWSYGSMGWATSYDQSPSLGFSNQYLAWTFADTTQGGEFLYGWIEVSLSMLRPPGSGPKVTITGYAYEDTPGVKLNMGQIPEPSSGGLLALGALALGSRGLRRWRRNRSKSGEA